jgi:hypothetical protein
MIIALTQLTNQAIAERSGANIGSGNSGGMALVEDAERLTAVKMGAEISISLSDSLFIVSYFATRP